MIHLVTGGSGSGKSAFAEDWLVKYDQKKYIYIATMRPFGTETMKKIERHRRLRQGKGFQTLECYGKLTDLSVCPELSEENHGILLECMSNHLANLLYTDDGTMREEEEVFEVVMDGIHFLTAHTERLSIVTNEVHADADDYQEETAIYIRLLGRINQAIGALADQVTEVVYGIPVAIKEK